MAAEKLPGKNIKASKTVSTVIREPREGKGWPKHAALTVTHRPCCGPREWERSVCFHEMAAAVLLPAGLAVLHAEGLFFAEANGGDAVGGNAQRNDVLLDGACAAITEAQVVFGGTTLVAMAFDGYFDRVMVLQEVRGLGKRVAGVGTNISLVVVEIGIAHFSQEELVFRGPCWRRRRWRRCIHRNRCRGAGGAARTGGRDRVGRRIRRCDLGGALSGHGANIGSDAELRGIGG